MTQYDDAVGRYAYVPIEGVEHRVYFEEAGSGPALLLQHTAGSDGRQWRHLLEDRSITSRFRVIAYDLPLHGKSLPAPGSKWWTEQPQLTTQRFTATVVAIADALELDTHTSYIGCSMGGHLAGDLALRYPGRFRLVVGIEGGVATHGSPESLVHMNHPRVTAEFKAAVMYSLTAPQSVEEARREATWGYLCQAPSAHRADLFYYIDDHDLSETAASIDTRRTAVVLMTGEYDWSVTPENTEALASLIPGAQLIRMPQVGHFPMVENYDAFRSHLEPVLETLAR